MAAPSPTARATPSGLRLRDGFRCLTTFSRDTDVSLFEMTSKPPGIDGGEPIDTVTQHNVTYRTMAARALKTLTQSSFKFAYDPAVYTQLNELINMECTITHSYADGSTLCYYGFLKGVEFDEMQEGQMPTGTGTIVPTNWDYVNDVEAGPVVTSVSGT